MTRHAVQLEDKDSNSNVSSEVVLNYENFTAPLVNPAHHRIGQIERNIVIPVHAKSPPKVTPRVFLKRDNGRVKLNVNLNFDEGVMCHDKYVNGIFVENLMPYGGGRCR